MRVGFIGAGRRMQEYYMPVIKSMTNIEPIGFMTRSQKTADQCTAATSLKRYRTINKLAKDVDMLVICVPASIIHNAVVEILKHKEIKTPLLIETPIQSEFIARTSYECRNDRIICAAENWPYRPAELLKLDIVKSGLLGNVNVVVNEFRGYEYHGMAMMRNLIGRGYPVEVVGSSFSTGDVEFTDENGNNKILTENWDVGVITLDSGHRMINNFNSVHSRVKTRGNRSMRVSCTNGCMSSDDVDDFTIWIGAGNTRKLHNVRVWDGDDHPNVVGLDVTVNEKQFTWASPCHSVALDEQQLSTYTLLSKMEDAVMNGAEAPYPAYQAFIDWTCVQSLRTASAWGQKINIKKPEWFV